MSVCQVPDRWKAKRNELVECGCDGCQDALKMHGALDALVLSSQKTDAALSRLEASVAALIEAGE